MLRGQGQCMCWHKLRHLVEDLLTLMQLITFACITLLSLVQLSLSWSPSIFMQIVFLFLNTLFVVHVHNCITLQIFSFFFNGFDWYKVGYCTSNEQEVMSYDLHLWWRVAKSQWFYVFDDKRLVIIVMLGLIPIWLIPILVSLNGYTKIHSSKIASFPVLSLGTCIK